MSEHFESILGQFQNLATWQTAAIGIVAGLILRLCWRSGRRGFRLLWSPVRLLWGSLRPLEDGEAPEASRLAAGRGRPVEARVKREGWEFDRFITDGVRFKLPTIQTKPSEKHWTETIDHGVYLCDVGPKGTLDEIPSWKWQERPECEHDRAYGAGCYLPGTDARRWQHGECKKCGDLEFPMDKADRAAGLSEAQRGNAKEELKYGGLTGAQLAAEEDQKDKYKLSRACQDCGSPINMTMNRCHPCHGKYIRERHEKAMRDLDRVERDIVEGVVRHKTKILVSASDYEAPDGTPLMSEADWTAKAKEPSTFDLRCPKCGGETRKSGTRFKDRGSRWCDHCCVWSGDPA